jgi:hypothetical protein
MLLELGIRCSLVTVAEVGTVWLAWWFAFTPMPVLGAGVKTGENAVILNRR